MEEFEATIKDLISVYNSNKVKDEETRLAICENMLGLLIQYFDNGKGKDNQAEFELNSCRYSVSFLLPAVKDRIVKCDIEYQHLYYALYERVLCFAARRYLEQFFDYMEWGNDRKVLMGRRAILKPFLFYLNKAAFDPNLKWVIASYPPSSGKSITLTYFTAWLYGLSKNNSIIRLSYSDDLVAGFSRTVREIISNHRFRQVFPDYRQYGDNPFATKEVYNWKLKDSNVQSSHIAVSRDGQVTGKRANKAFILDDVTKGAEEATDSALHQRIYGQWTGNWINRRDGDDTIFVFAGTMWSPEDIINRVIADREKVTEFEPDKNFKYVDLAKDGSTVIIRVPLLDENDETTCKAVMSTKEARELRDNVDPFQWACVYQQDPIPAEGLDFADELLQHYEELPRDENGEETLSDYALAVLDTTRRGKDNAAMPIFRTDGTKYYMVDCIFKKKAMTDLYDEIIAKVIEHKITWLCIENNTDTSLKTLLEKMLEERGIYWCVITEKYSTKKKERRINDAQGVIRKLMIFKDKKCYKPNSDYGRFMKNFTTFSFDYPNRNDDAPDSLALMVTEIILERGKPNKPVPLDRRVLGI